MTDADDLEEAWNAYGRKAVEVMTDYRDDGAAPFYPVDWTLEEALEQVRLADIDWKAQLKRANDAEAREARLRAALENVVTYADAREQPLPHQRHSGDPGWRSITAIARAALATTPEADHE